jgi:cystathionine beta-lyase
VDATDDVRTPAGLKWSYHGEDVLPAWVAEMDYGLAPAISEALHAAVDRGDTGYQYPQAERDVAEAACSFWAERLNWQVSPDRVFPVPDVVEGIRRAIMQLTRPESPVAMHTPVYYPLFSMVERADRELIEVPSDVDAEGRYRIDIDNLDQAFSNGAGSLVLCNPWNPTGRMLTSEEVGEVVELAASHGARVITDEIHSALTYESSDHVVAANLDPETVVTVTSASKAWNLPGLKCAQVVLTNDDDVAAWSKYFTFEKVGVGTFGLLANAAGYADGGDWLDEVCVVLESNRALLGELVSELLPEVVYRPPEATYLAWLDFRPYGLDEPAAYLLEHAGVALTEGSLFRGDGRGHARLNFATQPEILTEIVERIGSSLSKPA